MLKPDFKHLNVTFPLILVLILLGTYILLTLQITNNYLPVWSDEFFYYKNAFSFFENSTLKAALTYNGTGSKILGADAHGFGYPLLNGGIAKIFGWNSLNFVYTNCFFIFGSLLAIWFQKLMALAEKLWITIFVLLFPFFTLYGFTFMQESIHVFFAIICSILIFHICKTGKTKHYSLFIFVVFIAALFRPLWLFWLVGLIPFAKNKFQRYFFILIFILGIAASFFYSGYFAEAVPNYFSSVVNLFAYGNIKAALYSLVKHLVLNIYFYFFSTEDNFIYLPIKYLIVIALLVFVIKAIKYKTRLYYSIALIGLLNFGLLFLLYDVFKWREIRVLSPFFYFCIPYLVTETGVYFRYVQLAALSVIFILTLPLQQKWIEERNIHSAGEIASCKKAYDLVAENIEEHKLVFINYTPSDSALDLISLPVKNTNGKPIRYIVPYYNLKREKYDYILSMPGSPLAHTTIISNKYYQLSGN